MRSIVRNVEVYNRDGGYDHGTDAGVYDIHSAAVRTAALKTDRGSSGL